MADDTIEVEGGGETDKLLARMADLLEKIAKPIATPSAPPKLFDESKSGGTSSPIVSLTKLFDKLATGAGAISLAADKFDSFQAKLTNFVQHIDPGSVMMMDYAFKDLAATIGVALQPVFEALVPIVEKFADVLANIDFDPIIVPLVELINKLADAFFQVLDACQPLIAVLIDVLGKAIEALIPLVEPLAEAFVKIAEALTPLVELLGEALVGVLQILASVISTIVEAFQWLIETIQDFVNFIIDMLNELGAEIENVGKKKGLASAFDQDEAGKKTRATAGRGVSFGDIESASKAASEAAAKMGAGGDPHLEIAKEQKNLLQEIKDFNARMAELMGTGTREERVNRVIENAQKKARAETADMDFTPAGDNVARAKALLGG